MNPITDKTIGTLVTEDANAAITYAGCATGKAEVVGLYELWRKKIVDFVADLEKKEQER